MSPSRPRLIRALLLPALALLLPTGAAQAQQTVRVATYNIKFFRADVGQARLANLAAVIAELDADVIGLQEIDDRAALERLFDPSQWDLVIDDDSNDDQDVALAVRLPLRARLAGGGLDAQDADFLFSGPAHNSPFPNRRDVLAVAVEVPGEAERLHVLVHHAKSRYGGRDLSDPRREQAARMIVGALEQRFDGRRYVLLGDFNDNPDDCSLNILETGQMDPACGPEEIDGPLLINLCEPLVAQDRVSWGLRATDIDAGVLNTVRPGSRENNNLDRGTQGHSSPILFDQILVPVSMAGMYVPGSARVFSGPAAVLGGAHQPSDHVPVYAGLVFGGLEPGPDPEPSLAAGGVRIAELLPNPQGEDRGREEVVLVNAGAGAVSLEGWLLQDRAGNTFALGGEIGAGARRTIVLPAGKLPLNNDGDAVSLLASDRTLVQVVTSLLADAVSGARIACERSR